MDTIVAKITNDSLTDKKIYELYSDVNGRFQFWNSRHNL